MIEIGTCLVTTMAKITFDGTMTIASGFVVDVVEGLDSGHDLLAECMVGSYSMSLVTGYAK